MRRQQPKKPPPLLHLLGFVRDRLTAFLEILARAGDGISGRERDVKSASANAR
jgi:hypothetical protein